jgi:hypothetical protein
VTTGGDFVLVGGDVVVVGGDVVVVVGGAVVVVGGAVVVGDVDPEPTPGFDVVVVVGGDVVVGTFAGTVLEGALAPGCSLATTRPMEMVAPVASSTAARVSRRRRSSARFLVSGELNGGMELIGSSSDQHRPMKAAVRSLRLRASCGYPMKVRPGFAPGRLASTPRVNHRLSDVSGYGS